MISSCRMCGVSCMRPTEYHFPGKYRLCRCIIESAPSSKQSHWHSPTLVQQEHIHLASWLHFPHPSVCSGRRMTPAENRKRVNTFCNQRDHPRGVFVLCLWQQPLVFYALVVLSWMNLRKTRVTWERRAAKDHVEARTPRAPRGSASMFAELEARPHPSDQTPICLTATLKARVASQWWCHQCFVCNCAAGWLRIGGAIAIVQSLWTALRIPSQSRKHQVIWLNTECKGGKHLQPERNQEVFWSRLDHNKEVLV